ncbi:MAG: peptidylprolyl isomerase [Aigarchaeota archaeon]|nr:peptidylprolyl isomerase [Aigarchaeota archaeon]
MSKAQKRDVAGKKARRRRTKTTVLAGIEAKKKARAPAEEPHVEKARYVLLNYTAKVKETGDVIETTYEQQAREAGIYKAGVAYEPKLVVPGEGWLLRAVEEGLLGAKQSETRVIEVPPEKAFGPRDPSKIRIVSLRKFTRKDVAPVVGDVVTLDDKQGVVRSVGSGRVQVDFNPALAGKILVYECTVEKIVIDEDEKLRALVHDRIPEVDVSKFSLGRKGSDLTLDFPKESYLLPNLQLAKRIIAKRIEDHFPDIDTVIFVEKHVRERAPETP